MYDFIKNKQELKELKKACENIIKNVQNSSLREYFTFQFQLIGSGMNNLITQNGETGEYDLDYNFILQKDKHNLFTNPKKIKELFIKAFNEVNPDLGFKPAENNTSVITSKLIYGGQLHFSFDVAIMCEGNNGNYLKLIHSKTTGEYFWNELKSSQNYQYKIKKLKQLGAWNNVREAYLSRKNTYLRRGEERASFSILLEIINEFCMCYKDECGL